MQIYKEQMVAECVSWSVFQISEPIKQTHQQDHSGIWESRQIQKALGFCQWFCSSGTTCIRVLRWLEMLPTCKLNACQFRKFLSHLPGILCSLKALPAAENSPSHGQRHRRTFDF